MTLSLSMKSILLALALIFSLTPTAGSPDLGKGFDASSRGDHAAALPVFRPLTERNHAQGQATGGIFYVTE